MWPEQDIPDVVEWLYNLRKQAMQERLGSWGMDIESHNSSYKTYKIWKLLQGFYRGTK